jgi:hypothetical protein
MADHNRELVTKHVYELWLVWSQCRMIDRQPITILGMLTRHIMREQFVESCIVTLGLEWKGHLGRRSLENDILQSLVGDRVLVSSETLELMGKLTPYAADLVELASVSDEELAS